MCGINGIFSYHTSAAPVDLEELTRTRESMRSRGPDAAGMWISSDGRVGLGHRRLSIIDVSERANQPMIDGDLVLTFNGEIYNYRELRDDDAYETNSDSEVLLRMHRRFGEAMLPRLRGMFAFAIWDARRHTLFLARDPYGIKPLYYANDGRTFRFASQAKALLTAVSSSRDPAGVAGFLLRGHVPEPFTIYEDIRMLPAGSWMTVKRDGASEPRPYFSIAEVLRDAVNERRSYSDGERAAIVTDGVRESVRYHLVSDIPVGAFLSAGRDSGSIVGLAAETGIPLQTITMRFEGQANDETPLAEVVARQYGTTHHTATLSRDAFRAQLPRALEAMDQPTLDGLNSYFVSAAAAELGWKVALSGTGGDELFGGYSTFRNIPRFVRAVRPFRRVAAAFRDVYRRIARGPRFSPKTAYTLQYCTSYEGAYLLKRGLFLPEEIASVVGEDMAEEGLKRLNLLDRIRDAITPDPGTPFARIAAMESALLLRNQLLRDIDWASMAHSLEVRVPFVDAFLLLKIAPAVFSTNKRNGKELLARAPHRPLPRVILTRKKTGFTIPNVAWLEDRRHIAKHFGMRPWALYILEAGGHAKV
jgi:asparagine synthase (glutamine-hydrolysing)